MSFWELLKQVFSPAQFTYFRYGILDVCSLDQTAHVRSLILPDDVHKRYSSFYLISLVGSSLTGVLAYGISQMGGLGGLQAWQWIFVIEGLLTCLVAVIGYVLLVNFPQDAHKARHFLSQREIEFVLHQIDRDRLDSKEEPFTWPSFLRPALDWKIWGFALIFL